MCKVKTIETLINLQKVQKKINHKKVNLFKINQKQKDVSKTNKAKINSMPEIIAKKERKNLNIYNKKTNF